MKPSEVIMILSTLLQDPMMPVLLKGAPGVGKTSLCEQTAAALGYDFIVTHPVVREPIDYRGMPWVEKGKAEFIPFGDLLRLINCKKPTVVLIDDLGQAAQSVQAAVMQLLLAREINGQRISDNVRWVAATNRRQDRAGVAGILEPVKSRFATIIQVDFNAREWSRWSKKNGLPEELGLFVEFRPELVEKWEPSADMVNSPSARTLERAGKIMLKSQQIPAHLMHETLAGAVGEGFAHELSAYLEDLGNWPDIDKAIADPRNFKMPDKPSTRYALAALLVKRMTQANFGNIMPLVMRFDPDFQIVIVKTVTDREPKLKNTQAYGMWASANANVLI